MTRSNPKDRKGKNNPSSSRTSDHEDSASSSSDDKNSPPPDFNSSLAPRGNKKKARTVADNSMDEDFAARPEHVLSPTASLFIPPQTNFGGAPSSPNFFTASPPSGGSTDASNIDPSAVASRTRSRSINGNQSSS